ncbi:MAG: Cyclin- protein fam58a [Pycnora praestabilis]|nr:MAG: Cyclin- protein fam58a [Pycnora praestabilis]
MPSAPSPHRTKKIPPASPNSILQAAESQWIFSDEELSRTPSALDGMPLEKERESRGKGVNFITQVGIMLKLPQLTLATASVFLHRFFMRYSMVDVPGRPGLHYYAIAATSIFLATKVEENCRKMRELVIACCRVAQKNPNLVIDEQSKEYWRWRDTILHNEDLLLEAMCFDLSLEPPYKTLYNFLVYFGEDGNKKLRNAAWAFVNDSNLTMLCLLFTSRTIAAAALYCAAKHCSVAFADQDGRPWWEVVGVGLKDIRRACNHMATVYEDSPLRHSENIYSRTPEDGDPLFARTRARGSQTPGSPAGGGDVRGEDKSRGGSAMSISGSDQGNGHKRPRQNSLREEGGKDESNSQDHRNGGKPALAITAGDKNGDIPWGGQMAHGRERDAKRIKTEDRDKRDLRRDEKGAKKKEDKLERKPNGAVGRPPENGSMIASSKDQEEEDLSEEGEVEEGI